MKKIILILICILQISASAYSEVTTAKVSKVLDGSTIQLENGEIVKMLGVETPREDNASFAKELKINPAVYKQHTKKSVNFLKKLVEKKEVVLLYDETGDQDVQGRKLAYIFGRAQTNQYVDFSKSLWIRTYEKLKDGKSHLNINATVIQSGHGFIHKKYPFKRLGEFQKLQDEAKKTKRGIWK